MLNVEILEDDYVQQQQIKEYVEQICQKQHLAITVRTFSELPAMVRQLFQPNTHNLYIIDLEINGDKRAGLKMSQVIRNHDQLASIVFITIHDEFLYQTYKYRISALDFIAKDLGNIQAELEKDINYVHSKANHKTREQPFRFKDYSNIVSIDFTTINFFESNASNSHSSILNTVDNQQQQINYNLHEIEKMDPRFFRIHRSFLINPQQVQTVNTHKNTVTFFNGATCPASRLRLRQLLKKITIS